jgi:ribosomal protein S8
MKQLLIQLNNCNIEKLIELFKGGFINRIVFSKSINNKFVVHLDTFSDREWILSNIENIKKCKVRAFS